MASIRQTMIGAITRMMVTIQVAVPVLVRA
jgi:hypothetical protein